MGTPTGGKEDGTHTNVVVPETLCEHAQNGIFMLFLNNTGRGGENTECCFTHTGLRGLTCLEKHAKQFWPLFSYRRTKEFSHLVLKLCACSISSPLSVYCLAISAIASPTLLRTSARFSLLRHDTSFSRITILCSGERVEKSSLFSFVRGSLEDFVAILRNRTAEKERVCRLNQ